MKKNKRNQQGGTADGTTPPTLIGKALMWFVVLTCAVALGLLMWLARDILQQMSALGEQGGAAATRLLTGLFVTMCFAGFVAAALWAAVRKALGRGEKK